MQLPISTLRYIKRCNVDIYNMLIKYLSPRHETSFAKGIPATDDNRKLIDKLGLMIGIVRRYRGKRTQLRANGTPDRFNRQANCLSRDASTIALYRYRR